MKRIYWIFLGAIASLIIVKNKILGNYFNPESKEAKRLYREILEKIIQEYPEIEKEVILEINKELKCCEIEYEKEIYNMLIGGQVVFRKKISKIYLYPSIFSLLGYEKNNFIFIVAHELFHVVHYIYFRDDFFSCSEEEREAFANNKAINFLGNYISDINLEEYNKKYKNSKKIVFWHKMINNYAP